MSTNNKMLPTLFSAANHSDCHRQTRFVYEYGIIRRRRGALSAEGDEAAGEEAITSWWASPRHASPPRPVTHTALGLAALGNHGYNGGMGLGAPLENNLLIPRGVGGNKARRGEFGGNRASPDNESTPDTRQHPQPRPPTPIMHNDIPPE
ncbi:hypothetical protein NQZ68_011339 [Dissostichus eleginoides]|nr:hypothetical protein NQZ68_011339 [Dissostichus eleginoides]